MRGNVTLAVPPHKAHISCRRTFVCGCGKGTMIIESRPVIEGVTTIRRRRVCERGHRFTTYELTDAQLSKLRADSDGLATIRAALGLDSAARSLK